MLSHFSDIQLFCDPVDYSLPSFSVWDFPGKNTGLVAISFSRRSSPSKDQTWVSCLAGRLFTSELPGKPLPIHRKELKSLTWDVYFFVISSNLLMYMDFPAPPPPQQKHGSMTSSQRPLGTVVWLLPCLFGTVPQSDVKGCLLGYIVFKRFQIQHNS